MIRSRSHIELSDAEQGSLESGRAAEASRTERAVILWIVAGLAVVAAAALLGLALELRDWRARVSAIRSRSDGAHPVAL